MNHLEDYHQQQSSFGNPLGNVSRAPQSASAAWRPTPELIRSGYARKPIVGRCGENVSLHSARNVSHPVESSNGQFHDRQVIFQELLQEEPLQGMHPVIGSWIVGAQFAGFGIRDDTSRITGQDSPFRAVRIVPNVRDAVSI